MSAASTPVTPAPPAMSQSVRLSANWDSARKLLLALTFASLLFYCAYSAFSINQNNARLLHNAWDNMYPEGPHVYAGIRAAQTGRLYFSYRESPHIVQSYGPLFYVVAAGFARAAHLDVDRTIEYGRFVCYLSYLLVGVCAFLICRRLNTPLLLAAMAALMAIGQRDFLGWNATVRPDLMMLLFMAVGLWLILYADEYPFWAPFLSGACAGFACLFKQPGAGVAISSVLVLLYWKEFRKAIILCLGAAIPVICMFVWLILRKEQFIEQFRAVGKAIWLPSSLLPFFWHYIWDFIYAIPVAVGVIGIFAALRMGKQWHFVAIFTLVNGLIGVAGLPQLGANTNYFLPGLFGCGLLLPAAYWYVKNWCVKNQSYAPVFSAVLIPCLVLAALHGDLHNRDYVRFFRAPDGIDYRPLHNLRLLTDVPDLSLKGRSTDLLDAFAIHSLEITGNWDSAPVIQKIQNKEFDLVIFKRLKPYVAPTPPPLFERAVTSYRGISDYSPAVISAINDNYEIFCSSVFAVVLQPRGIPTSLTAGYFSPYFPGFPCQTSPDFRPPKLAVTRSTPQHYETH